MNTFKMIILFLIAYFFKLFIYTLVAFINFGILRFFSCGVHANTSLNLLLNKNVVVIMYIISLILVFIYATADTEEHSIGSKHHRKALTYG